ncbi:hypothetical protein [Enterobacter hormaechei]|uniref:hypothetical protein n=1 Tax=Enterobacter hormaechei TaxID=158836 RepID=UPI002011A00B|nr:hypothetical protein [Enterobacter hormaechei]
MTTQITIRNKQADNLLIYIEKYKAKFEERLVAYNAVGQLEWNAGSWRFGEKGVAWLKETKDRGFKWDEVSSRIKGLSQMNISSEFQDFMRAYHMHLVCIIGGLPSGSTLDKPLQVMKRWYWEMVNKTGQTHPMYLTSDIIHAAMERHHENSDSPDNVSDYCDIAVKAIALLRQYDLFLVNIEVKNKYPYRNGSNSTKERKKAQEATPDQTDDERLISIRAFMCVIELIALAENSYQRIFYNMLLLTIICGFRFQEIMLLKMTSLVKEVAIKWSAAPDMTPQTVLYRRPVAQFSNFQPKIVSSWLILALFQANFLISGRSRLCPYQLVNSNQVRQGE